MNKTPESSAVIRFQDCDPFGHLNNSRYIDYMFNAREDQLITHYGLDIFRMAKVEKRSWVSGQTEIIYMKPVFVMEKVIIQTQLIEYSDKYVKAEMVMYDQQKQHIKSVLWGKFFHFDLITNKGTEHTPEHIALFEEVCIPVAEQKIEERGINLTRQLKVEVFS